MNGGLGRGSFVIDYWGHSFVLLVLGVSWRSG
jgi:hypothetical protein